MLGDEGRVVLLGDGVVDRSFHLDLEGGFRAAASGVAQGFQPLDGACTGGRFGASAPPATGNRGLFHLSLQRFLFGAKTRDVNL